MLRFSLQPLLVLQSTSRIYGFLRLLVKHRLSTLKSTFKARIKVYTLKSLLTPPTIVHPVVIRTRGLVHPDNVVPPSRHRHLIPALILCVVHALHLHLLVQTQPITARAQTAQLFARLGLIVDAV